MPSRPPQFHQPSSDRPPSSEQQQVTLLKHILQAIQDLTGSSAILQAVQTGNVAIVTVLREILDEQSEQTGLLQQQTALLTQIAADLAPVLETLTASVVDVFSGDSIAMNTNLVFTVGQTSIDTITPFLADGVTSSGGVVSNVVITFSDPSATFVVNADNTVTWTAVAASTGPVSGTRANTITDTDGVVSQWSQAITVQTNPATPPPQQLTQSVVDVFSTPTP